MRSPPGDALFPAAHNILEQSWQMLVRGVDVALEGADGAPDLVNVSCQAIEHTILHREHSVLLR
jgi:hypothetical protein